MIDLPRGWVAVELGELGRWVGGGTPSKSVASYWDGDIPWVSPKDMKVERVADAEDHISQGALQESATNLVPRGAVLLVTRSGILRHTLPVAVADRPVALNQDLKALMPGKGVDSTYVAWALRASADQILRECSKAGTTVANIDTRRLLRFKIPLAPLAEQQRIVAAIEEHLSRVEAATNSMTAALVRTDSLRRAAVDATHATDAPFVSVGALLSDAYVFTDGDWVETKDQDPAGEIRLIQLADIGDGWFRNRSNRFMKVATAERLRCTYLEPGDVLIARMPDPLGRACIFPGVDQQAVTAVDVCIVRCGGSVDPRWLMHAINSTSVRRQIESLQSGTTRKRISRKNLATVRVHPPRYEEQRRLTARADATIEHLDSVLRGVLSACTQARLLRHALLASAFRGELAPQSPTDEPASVLLEAVAAERVAGTQARSRKEKARA